MYSILCARHDENHSRFSYNASTSVSYTHLDVYKRQLKYPGVPPGDISADQMDAVADLADRYSFSQIRATHHQNLLLADVRQADLYPLWHALTAQKLAAPVIGTLADMICCPGLDFCSLANASSISVAHQINEKFDQLDDLYDLGEIRLNMSGCMNACGHHHVGHIGILGVDKKGEEWLSLIHI